MLSPRYYDSKMNMTYTLEELREEHHMSDDNISEFELWINDMVESEILIPID